MTKSTRVRVEVSPILSRTRFSTLVPIHLPLPSPKARRVSELMPFLDTGPHQTVLDCDSDYTKGLWEARDCRMVCNNIHSRSLRIQHKMSRACKKARDYRVFCCIRDDTQTWLDDTCAGVSPLGLLHTSFFSFSRSENRRVDRGSGSAIFSITNFTVPRWAVSNKGHSWVPSSVSSP